MRVVRFYHQHADGAAAAQQGHAEEGVVRVFAGFRAVGEGRVVGGVRQVQRTAQALDLAHQALARLQPGVVHGVGVEALGGPQLQIVVGAAQIQGTHLGHHRQGDDAHDHVQTRLGRAFLLQGLADLAQ
jgi:hypothetical protein